MSEGLSSPKAVGDKTPGSNRSGLVADHYGFTQVPAWFDVRVFYVRVASCPLEDTSDFLTMRYPPRDISTALEVNGGRISPSEELKLILRRDRLDTEISEATYVSTDNFRASGTVSFEVYDKEQALLCGNLERSDPSADAQDVGNERSVSTLSQSIKLGWKMDLTCAVTSPNCAFFKGRHDYSTAGLSAPTMEVCVVGRYSGSPVILTEMVQLTIRRKVIRRNTLDAIVETDEGERVSSDLLLGERPEQVPLQQRSYPDSADKTLALGDFYRSDGNVNNYMDEQDGEMTWFHAGVRVGVGIGLGMCLGVGIGVGLLVRTYQATTRTFRRNLIGN